MEISTVQQYFPIPWGCGILVSSPDPTLSRVNSRFLYICFLNASAACVGVLSLFLWVFGYFLNASIACAGVLPFLHTPSHRERVKIVRLFA